MLYIGESAGAIIACPDISYNQIMDDKTVATELTNYSGMGLVDYYVLPHNGEFPFVETTAQTIKVYGEKINIFDEHAVVVPGYGEFSGLDRDQARDAIVAWFEEHGEYSSVGSECCVLGV